MIEGEFLVQALQMRENIWEPNWERALDRLRERFTTDRVAIPQVAVELVSLCAYDELAAVAAPNTTLLRDGGLS